jgi:hypothetical protein
VFVERQEWIGVIRGLQEAGRDVCGESIMGGLRRELGWAQAAKAKQIDCGSGAGPGAGPKTDPVLDTGMVQAAVEVG